VKDAEPKVWDSVLVVDDERDMAESCAFFLQRAGYEAQIAGSGEEALDIIDRGTFGLVVSDLMMPGMHGLELLTAIKSRDPDIEVVMVTGFPEIQTAVRAIKGGAWDYLTKPFAERELMSRVEKALAHRRLKEENAPLRERLRKGGVATEIVYRSKRFGSTVRLVEKAARSDASVLILGESGTGKELLAHHLHASSERAERPFVPVDCTSIPSELVESELFGHVRGAFTGAERDKVGLFQVADGGTLFLDEVGELPLAFQPKLLRAIQERSVRPVGATARQDVDVRIVCATNRDLQREVKEGRFREDLFYRLDVVRLEAPPLRDRMEDLEPLADHFVRAFAARDDRPVAEVSPEFLSVLRAYSWPGNVRQFRNVIERACALGDGHRLEVADLPPELRDPDAVVGGQEMQETFQEMKSRKVAAIEKSYVEQLLQRHFGNVTRAAEDAGMARSAFQKLMRRYSIESSAFRN